MTPGRRRDMTCVREHGPESVEAPRHRLCGQRCPRTPRSGPIASRGRPITRACGPGGGAALPLPLDNPPVSNRAVRKGYLRWGILPSAPPEVQMTDRLPACAEWLGDDFVQHNLSDYQRLRPGVDFALEWLIANVVEDEIARLVKRGDIALAPVKDRICKCFWCAHDCSEEGRKSATSPEKTSPSTFASTS